MENIISVIAEVLKESDTLLEAELQFEHLIPEYIQSIFKKAFDQIDKELVNEYKEKDYEIDRKEKRKVQFSFGTLEFERRRMRKKGEKSLIPFDKAIGLKKGTRYSPIVEMKGSIMASYTTYRTAAQSIRILTPIEVSHTKVHSMTQETGQRIQDWTDKFFLSNKVLRKEKKKVSVLYIEGDGLLLKKGAQKKRPELHRVQIHEGVRKKGKQKRPELIHAKFFESTVSSHEAFKRASQWIEAHYNLRDTIVISNSDGGAGYRKSAFDQIIGQCKQHEHFRDQFHVNQKIKQRLYFDKRMHYPMKQAIRKHDWEKVVATSQTIESRFPADLEEELIKEYKNELDRLLKYFIRNWASLEPKGSRELHGLQGLGVCETNHRPYSYRMKRQGRNFTSEGAGNLASIISSLKNGTFVRSLTEEVPEMKQEISGEFKRAVQRALKKVNQPSIGAQAGSIANYGSTSSPIGQLQKMFS